VGARDRGGQGEKLKMTDINYFVELAQLDSFSWVSGANYGVSAHLPALTSTV